MTDLSNVSGTWNLDVAHTRLGFAAKHAMVTTVRGAFGDFEGSLVLDGENPARDGVATGAALDKYTTQAITPLHIGYSAFAGQRDDGFYADIQSIFDLLQLRNPGKDSQGGFNIHLMALEIPMSELGGDKQVPYIGSHREANPFMGWRSVRMVDPLRRRLASGQSCAAKRRCRGCGSRRTTR
jgi:hypothetical protein